MGSGKGAPDHWVCVVQTGRILFEVDRVREDVARAAMRLAQYKLPVKTRFVTRADFDEVSPVLEPAEVSDGVQDSEGE